MTMCTGRQAAAFGWGWAGVAVICISLWLTRWARLSLKSQGSQLRGPPSDTSPHFTGPTSFYFGHAHFPSLSPTLSPVSLSLLPFLLFEVHQRDEKWRAAGRLLPSPRRGQQFTVLIETLAPPLMRARHTCTGRFCLHGWTANHSYLCQGGPRPHIPPRYISHGLFRWWRVWTLEYVTWKWENTLLKMFSIHFLLVISLFAVMTKSVSLQPI